MRAGYGKTLRRLLGQGVTLRTVIDFGDLPVFEATTYPTVLVMRKRAPAEGHTLQALTVDDIAVVHRLADVVRERAWLQPQVSLRPDGWTLVRAEILDLVEKLRATGRPLEEVVNGRFYRGVVTGLNQAFVIDEATRQRLIEEDPRSAEIIKPWLRGRDVKRWRVEWAGVYVIFTYHGVDIDCYPAIRAYLEPFRERLERRATSAHHAWYELQQPQMGIYPEFEVPKIIYPDIAKRCEFAYDDQGRYGGNTIYFIPSDDLTLLGILNSQVVEFFYRQISSMIQQDYLRFFTQYLSQIPVPAVTPAQRTAIEALVRKLLDAKGQGPQVAEWERELNAVVYEVYGLGGEEVAIIESICS
ncbi:MAG: hypothetical protein DRQ02_09965 [Candidatus Latescibacterota bacterium]|nr:MAG: hypothetical protein DRQ02_09965 [Candidatus Latescibacterota bacterium]